ncbi:MAG: hypothetical protein M3R55_14055 [Acidobacteriota bacterium]|nr:hypothetical protein [Acidobacteriota bacterium]
MTPELALRGTIWLAVIAWASAEVLRRAGAHRREAARAVYAAGALLLAGHTAAAFQYRHAWSHAAAFAETARRSGEVTGFASGTGLYLNYLFVACWAVDAAWWWIAPRRYMHRTRLVDGTLFAFFLFMVVNGAVVFVTGPMRIAGAAAVVAALAARLSARGHHTAREAEA